MRVAYSIKGKEFDTNILLDTINDSTINIPSTISTHPVASGEIIADHKYDEPITMSISGSFSINNSGSVFGEYRSLSTIQSMFEQIKKNGELLTITKVTVDETKNTMRFTPRHNMVLRDISWTERINSLDYVFTFMQILTVDVDMPNVDTTDETLPDLEGVVNSNFTETLLNWDDVDRIVVEVCKSTGFMSEEYASYLTQIKDGIINLNPIPGSNIISNIASNGWSGLSEGSTYIEAALKTIGGLPFGIYQLAVGLYKTISQFNYQQKVFNLYEDEKRRKETDANFETFNDGIHVAINQLNNAIDVYQVSVNKEQTCIVSLQGVYYRFVFEKNTLTKNYRLNVYDMDNSLVKSLTDITSVPTSIDECGNGTQLFYIENSGYPVYLLYTVNNLYKPSAQDVLRNPRMDENNKNDLTNYYIISSRVNLQNINNVITDVVKAAIQRSAT